MATREQAEYLLREMKAALPPERLRSVDTVTAGMRAILNYLYHVAEAVPAGGISKKLGISTARVTVLLKKMDAKGWIERARDPKDARVVLVSISEQGARAAEETEARIFAWLNAAIDKVGMERMLEFVAVSNELRAVLPSEP